MIDSKVPDPGPIIVPDGLLDGDKVAMIFAAEGFAARDTSFEPSLLAQLARLCHDFSIPDVGAAAQLFGPMWPQLSESALTVLADRFEWGEFETQAPFLLDPADHAVYRCLARNGAQIARADKLIATSGSELDQCNRRARLLVVAPRPRRLAAVLDLAAGLAADLEPEPVRAIIATAAQLDEALPVGWIEAALDRGVAWRQVARAAHILPALPAGEDRTARADALAEWIIGCNVPPWQLALAISRLGALVSSAAVWQLDGIVFLDARWLWHLHQLASAPPAASLAADVRRSHPFDALLAAIGGPHETTAPVANEMLGRWGPRQAAAGPPPTADPEPAAPEPAALTDQRRFGVDVFHDGTLLRNAMVADQVNTITVSYGTAATAQVGPAGTVEFTDTDRRTLPVILVDTSPHIAAKDQVPIRSEIKIRKDPTSSAEVEFDITPRGAAFSAFIAVLAEDGATVIQAASMTASVAGSPAAAQASTSAIRLDPVPVSSWQGQAAANAVPTGSVIHDQTTSVSTTPGVVTALTASVDTALAQIAKVSKGFKTAAGNAWATGDRSLILPTLVGAARSGYKLRTLLGLEGFDVVERLQVVSTSAETILPLELVYGSKRAPKTSATVCEDWFTDGTCSACADRPKSEQATVVCPSLFWGLSKIIEHHGPASATNAAANADFSLRVIHEVGSAPLSAPRSGILAMSARVVEVLQHASPTPAAAVGASPGAIDAIGQVLDAIRRDVEDLTITAVTDWDGWVAAVENITPDVLIAMPHNENAVDVGGIEESALEIGGSFESIIDEEYVRPTSSKPGPLVLLIGCNTGVDDAALASFAAQFRRYAPVVIATFGEIIAEEAPGVVASIMLAIEQETDAGGTLGGAVRSVRRRLLHDRRLAGLQLVVHGESSWPLTH